jgi:hypothetical protein
MAFLLDDRRLNSSGPAMKLSRHHGGFKTAQSAHRNYFKIEAAPPDVALRDTVQR